MWTVVIGTAVSSRLHSDARHRRRTGRERGQHGPPGGRAGSVVVAVVMLTPGGDVNVSPLSLYGHGPSHITRSRSGRAGSGHVPGHPIENRAKEIRGGVV